MKKPVESVKTTVRIQRKLWDRVRIRAIQQDISVEALVNAALAEYLKREGSKP